MNNIDRIEIIINSLAKSMDLCIVPNELKVYINDYSKNIDKEIINEILSIVNRWNNNTTTSEKIDDISYEVRIYIDNDIKRYYGRGNNQECFYEFLKIVGDIYG